jgi:hypothetical protein
MSFDMTNIMNNIKTFFEQRNINYVIGGGYGVSLLCNMYQLDHIISISNLDIFYMSNTPITAQYISNYKREQDCPHTSVTYITEEGFRINATMLRINSLNYIKYGNINIMHPTQMLSYYHDEINLTEFQFEKVCYLEILENMVFNDIVLTMTRTNQNNNNSAGSPYNSPTARRLCLS